MALTVLTSAANSPGVTTTAIGVALTWPRPVVLVDCDPAAGQSVLAGFLGGSDAGGKGLVRVAEAHRDQRGLAEVVIDQTVPLTDDPDGPRFLPGFAHRGSVTLFGPVWHAFAEALVALQRDGIDVVIDAGRLSPNGLPQPIVDHSATVGLLTRTNLRAVAAAAIHLPGLAEQSRAKGPGGRLGLVLVGDRDPYSGREISDLLDVQVLASLAADHAAAACISDRAPRPRRFEGSAFAKSVHHLTTVFETRASRARQEVLAPT